MQRRLPAWLAALAAGILLGGTARATDYYVDASWTGTASGTQSEPYRTIGAAVAAANAVSGPHHVYLAAGIYADTANGGLETYSTGGGDGGGYRLDQRISGFGGYAGWDGDGTEPGNFDWTSDTRVPRATIIDLRDAGSRAFFRPATGQGGSIIFDGLTFRDALHAQPGGALYSTRQYLHGTSLRNCLFTNNVTAGDGGAAYLGNEAVSQITDCDFIDNQGHNGGALYWHVHYQNDWLIENCGFSHNTATGAAGAVYINGAYTKWIRDSRFTGNSAGSYGGAIFGTSGRSEIERCAFIGNAAGDVARGGAAVGGDAGHHTGSFTLINCLVQGHTGGYAVDMSGANVSGGYTIDMLHCTVIDNAGGGVRSRHHNGTTGVLRIRNSIIANNGAYGVARPELNDPDPILEFNNVYNNDAGNYYQCDAGNGSIAVDPVFADGLTGDYRLAKGSPCIDSGMDAGVTNDLDGVTRPTRLGYDMGCYEEWQIPIIVNRAAVAQAQDAEPRAEFIYESEHIATDASFVLDTVDRGTNAIDDWWQSAGTGEQIQGVVFGALFFGLSPETTYWYRCLASNDYDVIWGPAATFKTATITGGATREWTGLGGNALASNPANWTGGLLPGATDYVLLDRSSSNMTWDAGTGGLTDRVARWTQTENYTGTVTIPTRFEGQGDFHLLTIDGDGVIAGGVWTHPDDNDAAGLPWTAVSWLNVQVGGDFTLTGTARIDADRLGYNAQRGPGRSTGSFSGGGHGGLGTSGDDWLIRSDTYGSITTPTTLGSGGQDSGAEGGGAVRLAVLGDAEIADGAIISADGNAGRGGGAGGSILIMARGLNGGGTIRANGGSGASNRSHGGGGGRVALKLTGTGHTFTAFNQAATVEARGGSGSRPGAAGTVYLEEHDQAGGTGTLIVDNDGLGAHEIVTTLIPPDQDLTIFSEIVIRHAGILGLENPAQPLTYAALPLCPAGADQAAVRIAGDDNIIWPETLIVEGYTLIADGIAATLHHLQIGGVESGVITHPVNRHEETYRLQLTLTGDLVVKTNGRMHADGRGFRRREGPGVGALSYGHGAAHGGQGAWRVEQLSTPYGSIRAPVNLGSGTGDNEGSPGHGGGAIRIDVGGLTTVEEGGIISTQGGPARGGGSGGSIWLQTQRLAGGGALRAHGGNGDWNHPYGGGGGRIAVRLTEPGQTFAAFDAANGTTTAIGGAGGNDRDGAAGTVYRETGDGLGVLIVDNAVRVTRATVLTELPPGYSGGDPAYTFTDSLATVTLWIRGLGRVGLTADTTVGDLWIDESAVLDLNAMTLSVKTLPHPLEGTVIGYGVLKWLVGSVFMIR